MASLGTASDPGTSVQPIPEQDQTSRDMQQADSLSDTPSNDTKPHTTGAWGVVAGAAMAAMMVMMML